MRGGRGWGCVQAKAEELQEGVRLLNERVRGVVIARQDALLQQLGSLEDAEGAMQVT